MARGFTRWASVLAVILACLFPAAAQVLPSERLSGPPKVILYYSGAARIRDVFSKDLPNLQRLLRHGGVAVMTTGPTDTDPFISVLAGRYVPNDAAGQMPAPALPPGVLLLTEPHGAPQRGDAILGALRARYPNIPVVAVHPGRWRLPGTEKIPTSLALPAWVAVSSMHGRLYSETTRRAGIVSNLDVAPTLARLATGKTGGPWPGHPIWGDEVRVTYYKGPLPYQIADAMRLQESLRVLALVTGPTNFVLAFGGILLVLLAALLLWPKTKPPSAWRWAARRALPYGMAGVLLAPVGVAVASGSQPRGTAAFYAFAAVVTLILLAAVAAGARLIAVTREDVVPAMLQLATGAAVAYVTVEVLRHGLALTLSPLSNFYLTGIRFYGLGNEYAALYLANAAVAALLTIQRSGAARLDRAALASLGAWLIATGLVVGWPAWGANFGGLLTAGATGGVAWALSARRSGVRLAWLPPLLVSLALVAVVVVTDLRSPHATHVGRFVRAAGEGTGGPLVILASKMAINLHLLVAKPALAIYVLAIGFVLLGMGPLAPVVAATKKRWPWAMLGVPVVLLGGLFGAVVNDTGIVMLGLMAIVGVGAISALALEPPSFRVIQTTEDSEGHRG